MTRKLKMPLYRVKTAWAGYSQGTAERVLTAATPEEAAALIELPLSGAIEISHDDRKETLISVVEE